VSQGTKLTRYLGRDLVVGSGHVGRSSVVRRLLGWCCPIRRRSRTVYFN
jgi:hypothetical protein